MQFGTVHCAKSKLNVFEIFTKRGISYLAEKGSFKILFCVSDFCLPIGSSMSQSVRISHISLFSVFLGKARLLRWDVAPLLDDGLLDLPGVGPGPGADLLGHVHALLGGLQLGNELGHMLASPLGLK